MDTPTKIHFPIGKFPNGSPIVQNGDGDGTVNIRSLEYCRYWKNRQKKTVTYKKFNNVEHMQTVSNLEIVKHVTEIITGIKFERSKDLFNDEHYFDKNFFTLNLSPQTLKKSEIKENDLKN